MLNKIKADALIARKAAIKDKSVEAANAVKSYTTIVGAITRIEIDERRQVTDADCIKTVKKILTGVKDTIELLVNSKDAATNADKIADAEAEKNILEKYIPAQLSEAEILVSATQILKELFADDKTNKKARGGILKELKSRHGETYDGTVASQIVANLLS